MTNLTRRSVVAASALLAPGLAYAQQRVPAYAQARQGARGSSPTVISDPPRDFGPGAPPMMDPDPDVLVLDRSFSNLRIEQELIHRIYTGLEWAEGPAWSNQGQYAVWSDVKGNTQYRLIWETREVTAFRKPSYNSNGNTFDFEGRQVSCQDFLRRVVRYEHDGSLKVLADNFDGKPLNSPNDLVPHPDGSIWFSDPNYGGQLSEGHPDDGPGPMDRQGVNDYRIGEGELGVIGSVKQVLPTQIYRWDPSGRVDMVATGNTPNGLAFSPDYKKLYFVWGANLAVADVVGTNLQNIRTFTDCMIDGMKCGPDGLRIDRAGNIWAGSTAPLGYAGVTVWNPQGKAIGRIRLPEVCPNICFAGPKRDWLLMCGTQSIYLLRMNIQGAAPG